jgi:hypothetical protein
MGAGMITVPTSCKDESQIMSFSGRMRKLLQDKGLLVPSDEFLQWHNDYQLPLLYKLNEIWGEAHNDARFANYGHGSPPWFDADPTAHWNGAELIYPPGIKLDDDGIPINKGSVQSFTARLAEKMGAFNSPHDSKFLLLWDKVSEAKQGCESDNYWDSEIDNLWP